MKGIANVLGHPVHPMLVTVPLGLLPFAVISDFVYLITRKEQAAGLSYYATQGGLAGGLLAGVFGLMDWAVIPNHTRAKRIGTLHGIANVTVLLLFTLGLKARNDDPQRSNAAAASLGALGLGLSLLSAWLGGELIYRLSIGVDSDAHPDASSSLKGN
jgi:uncharacterized membrane protein